METFLIFLQVLYLHLGSVRPVHDGSSTSFLLQSAHLLRGKDPVLLKQYEAHSTTEAPGELFPIHILKEADFHQCLPPVPAQGVFLF